MNNNFFEVLRPGINTTFQDKGRFGMQHLGVLLVEVWMTNYF